MYALLLDKRQETYVRPFKQLHQLKESLSQINIMIDFEMASKNALSKTFLEAEVKGCFYDLVQSLCKKMQSNGLQERYKDDAEFILQVRMLPALAFVSVDRVCEFFDILEEELKEDVQPRLDYFENTFIDRRQRRGRRAPLFSHIMWI